MKTPKRIWVRLLADNKISVGEYLNAKWRNIQDPFDSEDAASVRFLAESIKRFKTKYKREVEFVAYQGNSEAVKLLEDALTKYKL